MTNRLTALLLSLLLLAIAAPAFGEYNPDPNWKIAFIRAGDLWIMDADGTDAGEIFAAENITGRLSWSKDGKRIAFSRQGEVTIKYPDGGGGGHKCYDVFVTHIDSVGRNFWWYITDDLGSAFPEWSADDQLFVYHHDVSAVKANSIMPEYRIYYRNWNGTVVKCVAPEDAAAGTYMGIQPTMSPDKELIAYIYIAKTGDKGTALKSVGMVIVPRAGIKCSDAELKTEAEMFPDAGCPAFSPDGKSIAYINIKDYGIYLVSVADKQKRKIFTPTGGLKFRPNAISWSPDGKWLTCSSYDGNIHVVDIKGEGLKQLSFGGNDYSPGFSK